MHKDGNFSTEKVAVRLGGGVKLGTGHLAGTPARPERGPGGWPPQATLRHHCWSAWGWPGPVCRPSGVCHPPELWCAARAGPCGTLRGQGPPSQWPRWTLPQGPRTSCQPASRKRLQTALREHLGALGPCWGTCFALIPKPPPGENQLPSAVTPD